MAAKGAQQRSAMTQIADALPTKSAKIRALARAGYPRAEIARYLGIRYQHVRNVLVAAAPEPTSPRLAATVGPEGRIVIPAAYRQALGLKEGDEVVLTLDGDVLCLESRAARLRHLQGRIASRMKDRGLSVDAFLAERHAQARREDGDG